VTALIDFDPEPEQREVTVEAGHIHLAIEKAHRHFEDTSYIKGIRRRDAKGRLYREPEIISAVRALAEEAAA
jgi:hypothetical protein